MSGFNVKFFEFKKCDNGGVEITVKETGTKIFLDVDTWISIITEMSCKPENSDQHEKAKLFHLGNKK